MGLKLFSHMHRFSRLGLRGHFAACKHTPTIATGKRSRRMGSAHLYTSDSSWSIFMFMLKALQIEQYMISGKDQNIHAHTSASRP